MGASPQATPTYVPGSAPPGLEPDLSILQKNPAAAAGDSNYVATVQQRANISAAQQLLKNVDAAANPSERAQILLTNDATEEDIAALRNKLYPPRTPEQGAAMARQVEGPGGGVSSDVPFTQDPITAIPALADAGAIGGVRAAIAAGTAIGGGSVARQDVHDTMARNFPDHPHIVQAVDALLPGLLGAGMAGVGMAAQVSPGAENLASRGGVVPTETESNAGVTSATGTPPVIAPVTEQPGSTPGARAEAQSAGENAPAGTTAPTAAVPAAQGQPQAATTLPVSPAQMAQQVSDELAQHRMQAFQAEAIRRGGPMTADEVRALPTEGDGDHAMLSKPIDGPDLLRLGQFAGSQLRTALENARLARDSGNQAAEAEYEAAKQPDSDFNVAMAKWGAAVHQPGLMLRTTQEVPEVGMLRDARDVLQQIQDRNIPQDQAIRAFANIQTPEERAMLLDRMAGSDWTAKGALYDLYVNSILSFNSVGKKAASDVANLIWQIPSRGLAELGSRGYELATGQDTGTVGVAPSETLALTRGMVDSLGAALKIGGKSFMENRPLFDSHVGMIDNDLPPSLMAGSGFENTWYGRAIDLYGHLVSLPGRSMIAVDQMAKAIHYNSEMFALAQRQGYQDALNEGLEGSEAAQHASDQAQGYMMKPPHWMTRSAMKTALTNTFQADLEGQLARFNAFRRGSYLTRTLLPFYKTPVNITLQAIRQSPLAPLSSTWRGTVATGGAEGALAMSKAALGSAILGWYMHQVLKGNATGAIPENLDTANRNLWLRDNEPYSFKAGVDANGKTQWVSTNNIEPLSELLGLTADSAPAFAYLGSGDAERAVNTLTQAFIATANRQPMWGAVHTLASAMDNYEEGKPMTLSRFIGQTAAGFIPSTVSNVGGYVDPVKRQIDQSHQIMGEIKSRIPWLKPNGTPTLDPFGDPVIVPPGFMYNEFPAFKVATKGTEPEVDEIIRLHNSVGFKPPEIPRAIGGPSDDDTMDEPPERLYGAQLSEDERNQWLQYRANPAPGQGIPPLREGIRELIQSPGYKDAPSDSARADMMTNEFHSRQMIAKGLMLQNPLLQQRIQEAYHAKAQAMAKAATVVPEGATP